VVGEVSEVSEILSLLNLPPARAIGRELGKKGEKGQLGLRLYFH